jgi:hypothetical protein
MYCESVLTFGEKMIRYTIACIMLISTVSARLEVTLTGLSVHFGQGADYAPRKLDEKGIFVFNPGFGLGYDFRDEGNQSGFSGIVSAVWFRECGDSNSFIFSGGVRGRLMVTDNFSLDINVLPSFFIYNDQKGFLPAVTAGMNYHFTPTFSTGMTFAFVPAFTENQIPLGFFVLNLAF